MGTSFALALVGFTSVVGQVVLMREFIVVFNGNEISLGVVLATWLLWTALGSSLASRSGLGNASANTVPLLECLLAVSLPATVWAVRSSKSLVQTVPGESVGPAQMLLCAVVCLSVFCFLSGCLFVVAARVYGNARHVSSWVASSSAFLLEAAGSALGGILTSFLLLRYLDPFQISAVLGLLNLSAAIVLSRLKGKQLVAVVLFGVFAAVPLFRIVVPALTLSSQSHQWRGFQLRESRESIYGNLAVIENGSVRSVYDNGSILANVPDEAAAEEAVHYALLEHGAPKTVFLIGGGVNGSVGQILKHPSIERVDYVELDPMLIDMAKRLFPEQSAPVLRDGRVHTHYADGRLYLKAAQDKFDVIILNLPDPQTAQLNRFYTAEFYHLAGEHLRPGGLLALQLRASEDYISPQMADFLRCIQRTLQETFPEVVVIPGETSHFFAALQPGVLTDDPKTLIFRLQERHLQTHYVREYFIPFRMMPDRMAQIREVLRSAPGTRANRDFEPIAYYYDAMLWSAQFRSIYHSWLRDAAHVRFGFLIVSVIAISLASAVFLALALTRRKRPRAAALYCMAATGFTLMLLQIFVLLTFQSVYGYVYHQLAILVGTFMAGIALGSWVAIGYMRRRNQESFLKVVAVSQCLLALSGLLLLAVVTVVSRVPSLSLVELTAHLVFPLLATSCGILGGFQFPIATEIYLQDRRDAMGLGALYAVDLAGGCVGALLLSTYVIPVFGLWRTAWLSGAVNLSAALLAVWVSMGTKASRA